MKRKKQPFFYLTVSLLLFVLITASLATFIFLHLPPSPLASNPSLSPVPSRPSFRDLLPHSSSNSTNNQQPPLITLIAVGDIMLGRYCNVQMLKQKDFRYPFLKTADLTSSADIAFGNLEAPLVENCPTTPTGMIFCARPEAIQGLKFAGFDILSLANNHILNYGQKGLEQTQSFLSSSNILYTPLSSSNNLAIKQVNNTKFGFLSFDLVTYPQTSPLSLISQISPTVDILIVSLHWGVEYQKTPTSQQKDLAHQIIDSGAKVILGHHPHVIQPVEEYKGGLIFYSLGNFVFDQPWSEETKRGTMAKIIFQGKNIQFYELIPIYIDHPCQPQPS